jgi:hypothetical protein
VTLSDAQVDAFRGHEHEPVPGLFAREAAPRLAAAGDALASGPRVRGAAGVWCYYDDRARGAHGERLLHRIEHFRDHDPTLRDAIADARVMAALERLFGEPAVLFKEKINFKPPGASGFDAHQDMQAGWARYARSFVTVLVSLDATTPENGCLELAPHDGAALLAPEWAPLPDEVCRRLRFRALPTAPGDALLFDAYVPHRSAPNRTHASRRVLYVTYNPRSEGDHYARYYADKYASFPPDADRDPSRTYRYRV